MSAQGVRRGYRLAPAAARRAAARARSADLEPVAGFTSPLGEAVDCTTGPDACVAALARVEQDGSLSLHTAPLAVDGPR